MSGYRIKLLPECNKEEMDLELHSHSIENSIVELSNSVSAFVYNNFNYSANFIPDEDITDLKIYLNDKSINFYWDENTGNITFCDVDFGKRIFLECYGFVQISLSFKTKSDDIYLETDYIQVLVKKGFQTESVSRMAEFVYNNNNELLYSNNVLPKNSAALQENTPNTLESRIMLLKKIALEYERNYRYFRANSRFVTRPTERVDNFEKLEYISSRTIQYIAQHPEQLCDCDSAYGIRMGKRNYLPRKTLINSSECTYDIYENRCVVGFIKSLLLDIDNIKDEIKKLINKIKKTNIENNGYVFLSYFIYKNTLESLRISLEDIEKIQSKYEELYFEYKRILDVKEIQITAIPKPTHIFKAIPQYHKIYDCMVSWYTMGAFSLKDKNFMFSFLKVSTLYEVYLLSKFIEYYKKQKYEFKSASKKTYTFNKLVRYKNSSCNNIFIFEKGDIKVTLYYQPVVYKFDKGQNSEIGLYRNTSISISEDNDNYRKRNEGEYYSPDYIFKYESLSTGKVKYIIADAKFSHIENVERYQVFPLVYKYIFSISAYNENDDITALYIFNGRWKDKNDSDKKTEIYDYADNPKNIKPNASILTLTENEMDNKDKHFELLDEILSI